MDSTIGVSAKRYRYTGKERDEETGLDHMGARYYAPWLGRWTAADPIGLGDGPNRYAYVRGNPVRMSDPTGHGGQELQQAIKDSFEAHLALKDAVFAGGTGAGESVDVANENANLVEAAADEVTALALEAVRPITRPAAPALRGATKAAGELGVTVVKGTVEHVANKFTRQGGLFAIEKDLVDIVEGAVGLYEFTSQSADALADAAADVDIAEATGDVQGASAARERVGAAALNTVVGAGTIAALGYGALKLAKPKSEPLKLDITQAEIDAELGGNFRVPAAAKEGASRKIVPTGDVDPAADALAGRLGGNARSSVRIEGFGNREFDVVTDDFIGQTFGPASPGDTPTFVTKPKNFLSKSRREQIRETLRAAKETTRAALFEFTGGRPDAAVLDFIRRNADRIGVAPLFLF